MKNKIEIVKSSARTNRIKRTMIKFKCTNERKYTLITAQIMGYVATPYVEKCFMQSIPVPLLVNEMFVSKTIYFNAFLPSNLPPSVKTLQSSIRYFVVVKVFDGKDELTSIKGRFKLVSDTSIYNFREIYMLNQSCCRIGSKTYESPVVASIRSKLHSCDQMRSLANVLDMNTESEPFSTTGDGKSDLEFKNDAVYEVLKEGTKENMKDKSLQNVMKELKIGENMTEEELLRYKLSKISELGLLNEIKTAKLKYKRENKPNLHVLLDNEKKEEQTDIKLVIKDKKVKLAEIKMKNFLYTNDENVLNIKLLKEMKKIKIVVKMKEEAEYSNKEAILFIFERDDFEYLVHLNVFLMQFTQCTFNSDLFKVNFFIELKFNSYKSRVPITVRRNVLYD